MNQELLLAYGTDMLCDYRAQRHVDAEELDSSEMDFGERGSSLSVLGDDNDEGHLGEGAA